MMIRKFKFILPVIFVFSLFTSFQTIANNDPKDKLLLTILRYVLTEGHYQPKEINNAFSENVYDAFIENIDPSKRYFLQSDIDEFSKYRTLIDDQIKNEDLTFFYLVYNRFMDRYEASKYYYKDILAKPFDFNQDEDYNTDYKNLPYAKNKKGLKNNLIQKLIVFIIWSFKSFSIK